MAKSNNNLKSVLQDTADAIRLKTGSNDLIIPRDFADTIYSLPSQELINQLYSGTVITAAVPNGVTSLHPYLFWKSDTLKSMDFNHIKEIPEYCCYSCTNLENAYFSTDTKTIGASAFRDCSNLTDLSIPHTITRIDDYALYRVGNNYSQNTHTFDFINDENVETYVGNYAFSKSHISHLKLNATHVGTSAFDTCLSLSEVELFINNGSLYSNAFADCLYVEKFTFDSNSVITDLGSGVFVRLCSAKQNAIVSEFDMSKSTFTTLQSGIWYGCNFNGDVTMPSTVTRISANFLEGANGNWIVKFNNIPTVTSSSALRNDTSYFTVKYCFPYELLEQAKSTTNWSAHTSQIIGYGKGYAVGTTLPQYIHSSGVAISWFKDANLTIPITVSEGENCAYYCSLGTERVVWFINEPELIDGSTTISDGTTTYNAGDAVPINTQLIITSNYTDNTKTILYALNINGTDYTQSGSATITMTQNLSIVVVYWDGTSLPFASNLADNSWGLLKIASKNQIILSTWNVGDEKVGMIDGQSYLWRLTDRTGKFRRVSDNSIAWLTFECAELLPTVRAYNVMYNNRPLQSPLLADINSGTIYNSIESALTSVVEPVKVIVSQGGGSDTQSTLVNFEGKFFFAREHDVFPSRQYSVQAEWDAVGSRDEYYQVHTTNADRIKPLKGQTSGSFYWLISPYTNSDFQVCGVFNDGGMGINRSSNSSGVGLRFAI